MKSKQLKLRVGAGALMLAALPLAVTQALAATQLLRADTVSVTMPGGAIVPMWGYAADNAACGSAGVTVPGPAVTVLPADPTLTVTLVNCLPEPSSVVINGQLASAVAPVWIEPALIPDGLGGQKANPAFPNTYTGSRPAGNVTAVARSFTAEAAAGGGTQTYAWGSATSPLKPGSYLYQSGTHPQVQVQMGLYGALTKDAATGGVAYTQGTASAAYDTQVTLLYSEIDSALHAAVAAGTYGTTGPTSTLDYAPKYFLINGKPFDATTNPGPVASVAAGRTLLRFLNASLKTHVPEINGQYWKMIAEDGNPYPVLGNPRQQYTAFLTAGKTIDVMLNPPNAAARYAILDRRLYDTNNGAAGGGMLAYLDVTAAATAPVITSAAVTAATQGLAYSYTVTATDAPTDTLTYSLDTAPPGMTIVATGLVTWTPTNAQAVPVVVGGKPNSVKVRVTDQTGLFATQAFSVNVANVNDAPVAVNDSYTAIANSALSVLVANGVLKNDTDPDLDTPLNALLATGPADVTGFALNLDGSFSATSVGAVGTRTFTYNARDPGLLSSATPATVTLNVIANRAPTAVADTKTVAMRRVSCLAAVSIADSPFNPQTTPPQSATNCYKPVLLNVVANDTDPDTAIVPTNKATTPVVQTAPRYGTAVVDGATNTIRYTPNLNFRGTDNFSYKVLDNGGLTSATAATVRVNVQ